MIKVGMVIGDRYEILDKIGTGGMSDVYKAKDHKLNRMVAIKVLKQEFSDNTEFVSKFRVEAQAAAGLMHANIVNVYDVGVDNGNYYIVMELVEGITLKNYIEKKSHLSVKESISIAIQVAMGIDAAHNNNIIHRDIKPQNIMISKEGKVKVTDFGIAKAATGDTISVNAMGSVHYISPEQAKGSVSDAKSDIYSTGITLYEMLTGRVPFNADTTVAIALMQINEPMPSARAIVPDIPVGLEQIIYKCTMKSPDRRYRNMTELINDLKQILRDPTTTFEDSVIAAAGGATRLMSEGEISELKSKLRQSGTMEDREDERIARALNEHLVKKEDESRDKAPGLLSRLKKTDKEAEKAETGSADNKEKEVRKTSQKRQGVKLPAQGSSDRKQKVVGSHFDLEKDYVDDYDPVAERVMTAISIVIALVLAGVVFFLAGNALGIFGSGVIGNNSGAAKVTMPTVIGETVETATAALTQAGITYELAYDNSETYAEGIVMGSETEDGLAVKKGDKVSTDTVVVITVSTGTEGVAVPAVVGMPVAEATATLGKEGFYAEKIYEYNTDYDKDVVYAQTPEDGVITDRESTVTLYVSKGTEEVRVTVPNVMGKTAEKATELLAAEGLFIEVSEEKQYSEEYASGLICYQSFSSGSSVAPGSTVIVYISKGTEIAPATYTETIEQPADYVGPYSMTVTIYDSDDNLVWTEKITEFPYTIHASGFKVKSVKGTMSMIYTIYENVTSTDASGNSVTTQQLSTRTVTRSITFTK